MTTATERGREHVMPSLWAERRRMIHRQPWSFVGREYLKAIHDDFSRRIVVKKAAQMGFTELAQNRLAHSVDFGVAAMMVLPTDDDAKRHSKARFSELLDSSPYLKEMFTDVNSVDVKRSMDTALYFEGSNSRSALYSVPVGLVVVDERDRCVPAAVDAVDHRLDGHLNPCRMDISTPTQPANGVDADYQESDQKRWIVSCHHCEWTGPLACEGPFESWDCVTWKNHPAIPEPENIEAVAKTARVKCPGCGKKWTEAERLSAVAAGKWVAQYPERSVSGYAINQLCSSTKPVVALVQQFFKAHHDPNPDKMREFVNQSLGEPFIGEGEEITEEMVKACVVHARPREAGLCLGVDQGKYMDCLTGYMLGGKLVVVGAYHLSGWHEIDNLMRAERIVSAVCDQNPERRASEEWCARWPGVAFRGYHPEGMAQTYAWDHKTQVVQIAHVAAVDLLLNRIRGGSVEVFDGPLVPKLSRHWRAVNVVLQRTRKGLHERRVAKMGDDHLAFAALYLEAAASRVVEHGGPRFEADPELLAAFGGDEKRDESWSLPASFGDTAEDWKNF
ncbi:MAG: phage terminase large subunit family protein [Planctomycetes bacterium]|nr:phage terminase large subunit family protein [Planctomycetota bacterium]